MSSLCEELLVEIFARLPSKSLIRFKSLSNSWRSLISSSDFIRMHALRSATRTPQGVLIRHLTSYGEFYTLHSEDRLPLSSKRGYNGVTRVLFPFFHIIGSCNGILCPFDYLTGIFLWNPSIRRQLNLPNISPFPGNPPDSCRVALGFGFNPISDYYKVVSITYFEDEGNVTKSMVYTTKTGAWSPIASPVPTFSKIKSAACFFNGALHWVIKHHNQQNRFIMTFNLSNEVFGTIRLPKFPREVKHGSIGLTVIRESLAVFCSGRNSFWVQVMNEYNNAASWAVIYKLKIAKLEGVDRVLQLTSNGNFLLSTFSGWFKVHNQEMGARSRSTCGIW